MCKDVSKESLSHSAVWGSNSQNFTKQVQSRKVFHLEEVKTIIIELKWNAQGKDLFLIGFLLYQSHVVWETGFRIDSRTIKRGSQVSNFTVSFVESSNLCIIAIISFLVVICLLSL